MHLKSKAQPRKKCSSGVFIQEEPALQSGKHLKNNQKLTLKPSKNIQKPLLQNTKCRLEIPQKSKLQNSVLLPKHEALPKSKLLEQPAAYRQPKKSVRSKDVFTRLYLNLYSQKSRHNRMVINSIREARMRELWESRMRLMEDEHGMKLERDSVTLVGDDRGTSKPNSHRESMQERSDGSSRLSRSDPLFRALEFSSNVKGFSVTSGSADSNKDSSYDSASGQGKEGLPRLSQVTTCCFSQMCKELSDDVRTDPNSSASNYHSEMYADSSRNHKRGSFAEDFQPHSSTQTIQHTILSLVDQRTGQLIHMPCLDDRDLKIRHELSSLVPTRNLVQDMDVETEDETVVVAQRIGYATLLEAVIMYQTGGAFVPGFYC